jgi:hypothetical protein
VRFYNASDCTLVKTLMPVPLTMTASAEGGPR